MAARDIFTLTASIGVPENFNKLLVKELRKGSLEPEICAWLADFFENGGAGRLKFKVTRNRPGNPRPNRKTRPWDRDGVRSSDTWLFRILTEECRTKEESFVRAKAELDIGKNRAEKYWKKIKADLAREAEDPFLAEAYQGYKESVAQERADKARGVEPPG